MWLLIVSLIFSGSISEGGITKTLRKFIIFSCKIYQENKFEISILFVGWHYFTDQQNYYLIYHGLALTGKIIKATLLSLRKHATHVLSIIMY